MCGSYPYLKVRHFNLKKGVTPMETDIIFKMYSTQVKAHKTWRQHICVEIYRSGSPMCGGIYT